MVNKIMSARYKGYLITWDIVDNCYYAYDKITRDQCANGSTLEYVQRIIDGWETDHRRLPTELLQQLLDARNMYGEEGYECARGTASLLTGCNYSTIDRQVNFYKKNIGRRKKRHASIKAQEQRNNGTIIDQPARGMGLLRARRVLQGAQHRIYSYRCKC